MTVPTFTVSNKNKMEKTEWIKQNPRIERLLFPESFYKENQLQLIEKLCEKKDCYFRPLPPDLKDDYNHSFIIRQRKINKEDEEEQHKEIIVSLIGITKPNLEEIVLTFPVCKKFPTGLSHYVDYPMSETYDLLNLYFD
jgi:hypothetical protein